MPNVLLISEDSSFADDLAGQITHHAKDFSIIDAQNKEDIADIIIIDEDLSELKRYQDQNLKAPLFFLTSDPEGADVKQNINHLIIKPFKLRYFLDELQSSINIFENSENGYLIFNRYIVRPVKKDIFNQRNGELTKLTEKEIAVIKYLYKSGDKIVSKNELLQEVWGYAPDVSTHTIETHIYRLRQKVEHEDPEAQLILTVDGGYKLKF